MVRFLVTNATGYISLHIVNLLLKQGFFVRGTVRSLNDEIESFLKNQIRLELVEADLLEPESWYNAVQNIDIVIHVITPSPVERPGDGQGLMMPSVRGTLNVLNAAANSNVKRVIVNSSALTMLGSSNKEKIDENDWADVCISFYGHFSLMHRNF